MAYSVEQTNSEVLTIRHSDVVSGWQQKYLLMADVHWDNPHCDRKLLSRHLEQAKESNAGILIFGDWFCAMQGKFDPRRTKTDIRPEHNKGNYLDLLVNGSSDFLQPYRENLIAVADGNHETSIRSHLETDLLERLSDQIGTVHLGYSGFIQMLFQGVKGHRTSRTIYYHHGYGGGGPVTKGMIQTNRRSASVEADIFIGGHIHESWIMENVKVKLLESRRVVRSTETHLCLPTYKDEYNMAGGFHVERGRPAKPLGGYWLTFFYEGSQPGNIGYKFERAN